MRFLIFLIISFPGFSQIARIKYVTLNTQDLKKSTAFYAQALGLKLTAENRKKRVLSSPNTSIILLKNKKLREPNPINGIGISHICYQSSQRNSLFKRAKSYGTEVVSKNQEKVDRGKGIHYAYLRDPNHTLIEIEELENFGNEMKVGHVAISCKNMDSTVLFYTKLFNTGPINRINDIKNNPGIDAIANMEGLILSGAWFKTQNMLLEIWAFTSPSPIVRKQVRNYEDICFEVDDIHLFYENMLEKGVVFDKIYNGKNSELYLSDPDGNKLKIIQTLN